MANVTEEKLEQQVAELRAQLEAANERIEQHKHAFIEIVKANGEKHKRMESAERKLANVKAILQQPYPGSPDVLLQIGAALAEIGQPQDAPAHMDSIMRLQQLTQRWACNISRDDQEHIKTVLKMLGYPAPVLPWPDETEQSKGAPTE